MYLAPVFRMARLMTVAIVAIACAATVSATDFSVDNSDLYIATNEDGWGVELFQRGDVVFATIFTYGANNQPIFYTATLSSGGNAGINATWAGDLFVTQGPWFGAPFDRSKLSYRKVGTMTYVAESGALTFTVDGVIVTKQINRLTFQTDDYSGTYLGAYKIAASGCSHPSDNGTFFTVAEFTITQSANGLALLATDENDDSCTFTGDYQQIGQFGQSRGTLSCTTGITGTHRLFEMNVTPTDFRGRIAGSDNLGCTLTGSLSGIRQ